MSFYRLRTLGFDPRQLVDGLLPRPVGLKQRLFPNRIRVDGTNESGREGDRETRGERERGREEEVEEISKVRKADRTDIQTNKHAGLK